MEAIDQAELKQQHQAYQVLVQQKVLNDELKMKKARLDQEQGLIGPPSHKELRFMIECE